MHEIRFFNGDSFMRKCGVLSYEMLLYRPKQWSADWYYIFMILSSTCNDYSEWRPYYINPVYCMISWDLLLAVVSGALLNVRITELKLTEWKTV